MATDRVCAVLLEKIFDSGARSVVYSPLCERTKVLDSFLWTFKQNSFIPHGSSENSPQADLHPIWLTDKKENPNSAQTLMLIDCCEESSNDEPERLGFSKIIYVVSGSDEDSSKKLRLFYKSISEFCNSKFWLQGKNGDWQRL
jgi:DNA polymerase-3 subunit chi